MSYKISGTTVSSVDYTDFPFGGTGANGNALSSASTWISYTFTRPTVRTGQDGLQYFIVKNVSFRMCSAPSAGGASGVAWRTYGRVSWANGSEYANSYQPPNKISWQRSPTVTYTFQGTKFAVKEGSNGTTLRVWLVSAGSFLFQRNTGGAGHIVAANGNTYSGSPAGYLTVAQLASPPQSLAVVRTSADPTQVTVTWKPPAHLGGTGSGYHLEVAEDSGFTTGVRQYYPAIKSGGSLVYKSSGYSQAKAYWFRIAARNEVSEYFKLKGGQWSNVATIAIDTSTPPTPPTDTGVSGGTAGSGDPGGTTGSGGSTGGAGGTVVTGGGTGSTTGGTPTSSGGNTGTSGSSGASGSGSSGSTPTTEPGGTIVYTPIPDTSADRTAKNGLLRSRASSNHQTTVYAYDRGGKRRLGQLVDLTQISWSRKRDDISGATIVMSPQAARTNRAILDRIGVARSELVIYRGDERVWEGPITRRRAGRSGVTIDAKDVLWYASRTAMRGGYSNAYPNVGYVVDRIAGIMSAELVRLETPKLRSDGSVAVPPINVLPHLHTYVEPGDARTSIVTAPYAMNVWAHLDDLASNAGIDYTVVGRAVHIWDTSNASLGRTRVVTEQDFIGDPNVTQYGSEVCTVYTVTDGQGDFASLYAQAELDDPYYGELEMVATAYGSTSTTTTTNTDGSTTETTTSDTVSFADMTSQAVRGAVGRNPAPWSLNIPSGSAIDVSRSGLGLDVLIPGVYIPVIGTFSGLTYSTTQKVSSVEVVVTGTTTGVSESVSVVLEPASDSDVVVEEQADNS